MILEKKKKLNNNSSMSFLKKIFGWGTEDQNQTADQSALIEPQNIEFKGIKLFSVCGHLNGATFFEEEKKNHSRWARMLCEPVGGINDSEIQKLIWKDVYYPKKVMPWLSGNRSKITVGFFNLKKKQMVVALNYPSRYALRQLHGFPNNTTFQLEMIRILLIMREDIFPSPLLFQAAKVICAILPGCPVLVVSILNNLLVRGALLPFLEKDEEKSGKIVERIEKNIRNNCPNSVFINKNKLNLSYYIRKWVQNFWKDCLEERSLTQLKIIYFLLLNNASLQSISKVCEGIFYALSRIIQQNSTQKTHYTLLHPQELLDEDLLIAYFLKTQF